MIKHSKLGRFSQIIALIGDSLTPDREIDFARYTRGTLVHKNPWVSAGSYLKDAMVRYYVATPEIRNAGIQRPEFPKKRRAKG